MSNWYAGAYSNNEDFDGDPPKTFEQFLQLSQLASYCCRVQQQQHRVMCSLTSLDQQLYESSALLLNVER